MSETEAHLTYYDDWVDYLVLLLLWFWYMLPIFLDLRRSELEENHYDISSLHQGYFLASCHQGSMFLSVLVFYPHFLVSGCFFLLVLVLNFCLVSQKID